MDGFVRYLITLHVDLIVLVAGHTDGDKLATEHALVSQLALVGEEVLVGGGRDDLLGGEEVGVTASVTLHHPGSFKIRLEKDFINR